MRKSFHHRLLTFLSAPRTHRAAWLVLALSAVAAYLLIYLLAPTLAPGINFYLVQPLAWLLLGGVAALLAWGGWSAWPCPTRLLFMFAFLLGLIQTTTFLLAGIIFSLGYSPYAHRFPAVVGNLWYLAAGLFGLEAARATFVRRVGQHNLLLAVALGALIPTLLLIPPARWVTLDTPPEIIAFLGAHVLPGLAEGLVAALLAWLGGPLPAILYRALPLLFEWLSPVLPNLTWLVHAFIGTLVPLIGFFYLQGFLPTTANPDTAAEALSSHHSRSLNSWWWALLIALTVFWFNTGFFGVRPFVVSGYSMKPTLVAGDLVIVQPVTPEAVRIGDIIQFRLPGGSVVHRVVEIHRENNQPIFITQGDNNNVRDDPITPEQVQGRVILVIPRVGWPTLWLKQVVQWLF